MKYIVDNDLHIHSGLSSCSGCAEQSPQRILSYAVENNLKTVCITDHFWDEAVEGASDWYSDQDFPHISGAKPLPKADGVRFLFGCETEMDKFLNIGISKEKFDLFDFIIIPTTHFHMKGFTMSEADNQNAASRAKAWVKRFDAVLSMDLPFKKIGIAHLTCSLVAPTREERQNKVHLETFSLIPEEELYRLFTKAAALGVGIELNSSDMNFNDETRDVILRPYRIAKECGCKFYCGSDAHVPENFENVKAIFERAVDALGLTEEDKFII